MIRYLLALILTVPLAAQTAAFPSAIASAQTIGTAKDRSTSALNGEIDDSTTTVVVDDGSLFTQYQIITIDDERMLITGISSNTLTVTRAFASTSAAAHDDDAVVRGNVVAYYHNALKAEVIAIETLLGINGGNFRASGNVDWSELDSVPSTFTPATHAASHASGGGDAVTLAQSQVTNLTSDLAAKVAGASNLTTANRAVYVSASGTLGQLGYDYTDYARLSQANTFAAGSKQSFQASATTAGLRLVGASADPSSLAEGDGWYRTDLHKFRYYDGSSAVQPVVGGANIPATAGLIAFGSGAAGTLTTDTDGPFWDATNNRLGVGTSSPSVKLHSSLDGVVPNAALIPAPTTDLFVGSNTGYVGFRIVSASSSGYPYFAPTRSRGSLSSPTAVQADDVILDIAGSGYATNLSTAAIIRIAVDGTPGSSDMPGRISFLTTPDGSATPVERMRLTESGAVGIGSQVNNFTLTGYTLLCANGVATTGSTLCAARAGAGQSGPVLAVQSNGGSNVFTVDSVGDAAMTGTLTASSGGFIAGPSAYIGISGKLRIYSAADGTARLSNNATTGFDRLQYGGTTSAFPAGKRFGNALALRLADDTVPAFSALTTCASGGEGALVPVSDSSTATWGDTITGGGANHVLAYCNGTNWTVAAK